MVRSASTPPFIEELGIDHFVGRHRYVRRRHPVQHLFGIASGHEQLCERGLFEHTDFFAYGAMFLGVVVEPILTLKVVLVFGLLAGFCVPVGPLPAG